jgi:hypothetical protein
MESEDIAFSITNFRSWVKHFSNDGGMKSHTCSVIRVTSLDLISDNTQKVYLSSSEDGGSRQC